MRFRDALEGYWLDRQRTLSPRTVADYTVTFERFAEHIGNRPVEELAAGDVRSFLNWLAFDLQLSGKTQSNAWTAMSSFWTWAEREMGVPHVIRGRVSRPKFQRAVVEAYNEADVKAMLYACDYAAGWNTSTGQAARTLRPTAKRDKAIIIALVDTGLRASELCNLEIRDYVSSSGRLMVRGGKGDKDRLVHLGLSGRKAIWRYLAQRPEAKQGDPLFATRTGKRIDRTALLHLIQRTADRAGVAGANIHRFRHTFAVNFLRNGGNAVELQEMLGHADMETIRIYVRLAEVDLQHAQERASPADHWDL